MHAYLVTGTDQEGVELLTHDLAKKLKVKTLNFPLAKIDDARALNSFLNLKLGSPTAVIINSIDKVTDEAANAFLKNLEEPQKDLYFILTAQNLHQVLPTIVSRCQVIKSASIKKSKENIEISKFLGKSVGEKLKLTDQVRDREEAKIFVRDLITELHESLHNKQTGYSQTADNLEISQKTLANLEANGNVTLQLTNLVINLK